MKRLLLTITLLALVTMLASAQSADEQRRLYSQAENDYIIGRLDDSRSLLKEHLSDFQGDLLQSAYRLLILCDIALDEDDEAQRYVSELLSENPYFTPTSEDPQRFLDMVAHMKNGMTNTITTASSQAESLDESPVPVLLITDDMIRISGARNLKEVLIAYVPGMTNIDCNDDINIAMRGVYSQGQEKMLFMINGHRLNSYATNTAAPDFSISLEKIKQIEVLRGPASSLYGGVALTAVVNIITKQGIDVDGLKVRAGIGNYGQMRADLVFGKRFFDLDILIWGSLYKANGQKFYVPREQTGLKRTQGDIVIGRVGENPSYDLGLTLNWRGLYFMYNTHFSQVHSPYTSGYTYSPYNYDRYVTFRGLKPSFATQSHHAELSYSKKWDKLFLSAAINYDLSDMTHYQVISDSTVENLSSILGFLKNYDGLFKGEEGLFRYQDGQERTIGGQLKADYTYFDNDDHKGLVSMGANYSHFRLEDSRYALGTNYFNTVIEYVWFANWARAYGYDDETIYEALDYDNIAKGKENSVNAYVQVKHRYGPFILNGGLRYDYKRRFNDDEQHEFSPRVALIFVQPKWHATLSYSKSFVDAPYFYRKSNLLFYQLDVISSIDSEETVMPINYTDLMSERLYSWQLTLGSSSLLPGLDLELNGFYNRAQNLIYPQQHLHANAAEGKNIGAELTATYRRGPFEGHLAMEWLHFLEAEYFGRELTKMPGIPNFSTNAVLAYRLLPSLRLHTHLNLTGPYQGYGVDLSNGTYHFDEYSTRILVDAGATYTYRNFEVALNAHNLFNKSYTQCGLGSGPIRQQGRWLMLSLGYKF